MGTIKLWLRRIRGWLAEWIKQTSDVETPHISSPPTRWIPGFIEHPSGRFNARPGGYEDIDGIVIHSAGLNILDDDGQVLPAWEFMEKYRFSYHRLVQPNGDIAITVAYQNRAWHAGKSRLNGQSDLNDTFIGLCALVDHSPLGYGNYLKAIKDPDYFTEDHYKCLAFLCAQTMDDYPRITLDRIVRHSDVSGPAVRPDPKPDPGAGFDMDLLKSLVSDQIK